MSDFAARWQRPDVLQAIFDQLSDAIFLYDKNLHLAGVNKSGEQLLGLTAKQMIGKPIWELFPFTNDEPSGPSQAKSSQSWLLPTGTYSLHARNGRDRRVIIRNIELLDEEGALEGVVATAADITEAAGADGHGSVESTGEPERIQRRSASSHAMLHRSTASLASVLFVIFLLVLVVSRLVMSTGKQPTLEEKRRIALDKEQREATARFNAMTPAQHIERAKSALKPGATLAAIAEGLHHLKVVPPTAPEASRAKALELDLTRAQSLANAQSLIDASSNGELRDGMDKLQRATNELDVVARQYTGDKDVVRLSRAVQTAAEQLALRFPQEFASAETKLVDFTWEKGGFGTVMIANFTIRNDSPIDVGDLKIRCDHYAAGGVVVDQNAGTAFAIVKAHSTTRIPNVNMGFLSSQAGNSHASKTDCEILSLKLASQSQAYSSSR